MEKDFIMIFIKHFVVMKPHNYIYFNTKVCIYKAWIFHSPKLLVTSSDYHPNGESCSRTTTSFVLLHVCALKMCAMYCACSLYQVQYGSRKMGKKSAKKDLRPGMCVKYFLSFPQKKTVTRENWDKLSVYFSKRSLFNFWMIKFTVIPKKAFWQLAICQNWCFGQFYHSKICKTKK